TTPTALAPAVDEKTTDTDTDVGGGAVSSTKTTTSRTTAPQQPDDARPATTPTRPSSSSSSSPSSASTKGAVPATKSSSSTKALADEPTTSSSSITQANNVVGAQGGGGGDVATPGNTPAPANVMTATKGTGGILEYGECIDFENQCNGMCSYGIYSMNCIDGGICLCFKDDPDNTDTDTGADEDTADETDDDEDGSGNNKTRVSSHADHQMRLRFLGPARANLENAISTLIPLSGATSTKSSAISTNDRREIAVCVGSGIEPSGFQLLGEDIDMLASGLLQVAGADPVRLLLSDRMHKSVRSMVETRLISRLAMPFVDSQGSSHKAANLQVIDYSKPDQPSPETVLASATHIIATADDVPSVALGVSLGKPVYISGEERTQRILRNYYCVLDTDNLVRRFYPKGSQYSYMLAADITGQVDEFSAIRDHEPWAAYDAQKDIDSVTAFIHQRHDLLNS
ncbi:hypothetical protein H4R99_008335, partial [Coemansia sp. RSA 1722]